MLAQVTAYACELASGPLRGNISIHTPPGLFPYLRPRSLVVGFDVIWVIKLRGDPILLRVLAADLPELFKRQVNIGFAARRVDHLCPISYVHLLALFAHAFGHHYDAG